MRSSRWIGSASKNSCATNRVKASAGERGARDDGPTGCQLGAPRGSEQEREGRAHSWARRRPGRTTSGGRRRAGRARPAGRRAGRPTTRRGRPFGSRAQSRGTRGRSAGGEGARASVTGVREAAGRREGRRDATRRTSARSVPLPGPSSSRRTRLGEPLACQRVMSQMAMSWARSDAREHWRTRGVYARQPGAHRKRERRARGPGAGRTSPNVCEISGLVTKSPWRPKTPPRGVLV